MLLSVYNKVIILSHHKARLSLCLINHYAMKVYGGVDVYSHVFLTSLFGGEGQLHALNALTPGRKSPWYLLGRRLVGPRTGLGDVERRKVLPLQRLELRPPQSSSQSLYPMRYPVPIMIPLLSEYHNIRFPLYVICVCSG